MIQSLRNATTDDATIDVLADLMDKSVMVELPDVRGFIEMTPAQAKALALALVEAAEYIETDL